MRVLLLGGNGMLGSEIAEVMRDENGYIVQAPSRRELDITDYAAVRSWFRRWHPDIVINAAGAINARNASVVEMNRVNAMGAGYLASASHAVGARLVHVSTDCVFSGGKLDGPYQETDKTDATDPYGQSKRVGEAAVLGFQEHLVIRTSFIGPRHGFWAWLEQATNHVDLWTGAYWSGSTARDVARGVIELAFSDMTRVYHLATEGAISKAGLAHLLWKFDLAPECSYTEVDEPIINHWLTTDGSIKLRPLVDALQEYR